MKYFSITAIFAVSISSCSTSYSAKLIDEGQLDIRQELQKAND
jgi:hypothetical protein